MAAQYLEHDDNSSIPKGVILKPTSFNVKQVTNLRFEYRLELANVNYRELALGVEVANYLQEVVDTASCGGTTLPGKHLNPFQKEQEAYVRHSEKLEWARNERLIKRKEELKKLLNEAKTSPEKVVRETKTSIGSKPQLKPLRGHSEKPLSKERKSTNTSAFIGQHGLPTSPLARLRSPEHLSDLKKKAIEIKKIKDEAKKIAEKDREKKTEIMLFMKKKKNKEFIDTKVKEYDEKLREVVKEREKSAKMNKDFTSKAHETLAKMLKDAKGKHAEEVTKFKKEKEMIDQTYKDCEKYLQTEAGGQAMDKLKTVFDKYLKLKNPWPAKNEEIVYTHLPIKLAQRIFTDSLIVPQIISLKRVLELFGKSAKRQEDPQQMSFGEFLQLFYDIAIDFSVYGLRDPHYVRSSVILNKSALLSAKSKRDATPISSSQMLGRSKLQVSDISVVIATPVVKAPPKKEIFKSVQKQALDRPHLTDLGSKDILQGCKNMVELLDLLLQHAN